MASSNINIYILRLQGGRFYVGKTLDTARRYQEHINGTGSTWTRKYKPIALERVIVDASPFDEDRYVKELMAKYGIEKVRGGAYVTEELDEIQEEALRREIWGAEDCCTRCGRPGHFVKNCYARTDVEGNEMVSDSESDSSESVHNPSSRFHNPLYGLHIIQKSQKSCALVKETIKKIEPRSHAVIKETVKKIEPRSHAVIKKTVKKADADTCYRCGRAGHWSPDCYARTNVNGYGLDSDSD